MAKQTFTVGQVLTAAQLTSLQQTAMLGGSASAKTASYTLVAADAGTAISMTSTSATTITVNTGLFAAGDTVQITNLGTGVCTITAGTATVNTSATLALAQYESGTLDFTSSSAAIFIKGAGAAAASGGGLTLLSTTALTSGSTVTISSINQTYKNLYVLARGINTSGGADMKMRLNTDTGANYQQMWIRNETGTLLGGSYGSQTFLEVEGGTSSSTGYTTLSGFEFTIPRYAETEYKQFYTYHYQGITNTPGMYFRFNNWNNTAAITSLTFLITSGTYTAGNIFVYGVS